MKVKEKQNESLFFMEEMRVCVCMGRGEEGGGVMDEDLHRKKKAPFLSISV